jgi:hypothetical protein
VRLPLLLQLSLMNRRAKRPAVQSPRARNREPLLTSDVRLLLLLQSSLMNRRAKRPAVQSPRARNRL